MYKLCKQCDKRLEIKEDNFHRDKSSTDGFFHTCKTCRNARRSGSYQDDLASIKIESRPRLLIDTGFDEAAMIDRLWRDSKIYSIDKEAF